MKVCAMSRLVATSLKPCHAYLREKVFRLPYNLKSSVIAVNSHYVLTKVNSIFPILRPCAYMPRIALPSTSLDLIACF